MRAHCERLAIDADTAPTNAANSYMLPTPTCPSSLSALASILTVISDVPAPRQWARIGHFWFRTKLSAIAEGCPRLDFLYPGRAIQGLFGQPCQAQRLRVPGEIVGLKRPNSLLKVGNAHIGIEDATARDRLACFLQTPG